MTQQRYNIELKGCAPTPLAHYLKALGILRLVSEQADAAAQGWWEHDTFWLRSKLSKDELVEFFLNDYSPTPMVAPWNGGSGFHPKDNQVAITTIREGNSPQFELFRSVITRCSELLEQRALAGATDDKPALLRACRNVLPDEAVAWLDAAYILTEDGPKYSPLLGTGGNDGRLEFTNNYMQHLLTVLAVDSREPPAQSSERVHESLFAELSQARHSGTIGQFDPGNLGGYNNGSGFDGSSTVNAWDYILMLEGAIAFASAAVKKLESTSPGMLVYPFCVRPAGVGYESASSSDEEVSRSEMWMPLWNAPSTFPAISALLSEGRAEAGRRKARNGVDFARAVASLGVDRGIDQFQRYGFHQRNGLAYFAVPLTRFSVRSRPEVEELLGPLDSWLERFRRAATAKTAPARAGRALRQIDASILQLCQRGGSREVQSLLIALGEAEATVAISKKLRVGEKGSGLAPVPLLTVDWLLKASDGTTEFRLAAALASLYHDKVGPLRRHLEPIDLEKLLGKRPFAKWAATDDDPAIVWGSGDLVRNMHAVLARRLIEIMKSGKDRGDIELMAPLQGRCFASLSDIAKFIRGDVDDRRIEALVRGLMLLEFPNYKDSDNALLRNEAIRLASADNLSHGDCGMLNLYLGYLPYDATDHTLFKQAMKSLRSWEQRQPDSAFALFKLCHLPKPLGGKAIKLNPQITRRALAGAAAEATQLAARRLRASGFPTAVDQIHCSAEHIRRTTAALLFPISEFSQKQLAEMVLRREKPTAGDDGEGVVIATSVD